MIKAKILDAKGKKLEEKVLDAEVFEIESKEGLLKEAYVRYLANARVGTSKTKTRGERRGGGKKPWRQKGTGRARTGSSRNPIWRKGGVTFGPTGNENYTKAMNKRALRKAIKMSLSDKAKEDRILILDKIEVKSPKTKEIADILSKLPVDKRVLLVADKDAVLYKSTSNIKNLVFSLYNQLNVFDLMTADYVIILKNAYQKMVDFYKSEDRIGKKEEKKEEIKAVTKKPKAAKSEKKETKK